MPAGLARVALQASQATHGAVNSTFLARGRRRSRIGIAHSWSHKMFSDPSRAPRRRKRLASLERANGELPDVSQPEVPNLLSSPNVGF
jgi:hypothetical protein